MEIKLENKMMILKPEDIIDFFNLGVLSKQLNCKIAFLESEGVTTVESIAIPQKEVLKALTS